MQTELFTILDTVESTNNYAMRLVHEGLAKHGVAVFAYEQTNGKGQRGKVWMSNKGENITMSLILKPDKAFALHPFYFNAFIAITVRQFFAELAGEAVTIKWPNDIYWRDNKAGGILVENVMAGKNWKWAVVGIGLNINQQNFEETLHNPTSLYNITQQNFDVLTLAKQLYQATLAAYQQLTTKDFYTLLQQFNTHLYKLHKLVKLKKDNVAFYTTITSVNEYGQLQTVDSMERSFDFGEVSWVI
ncbi:biotin--[acetyl-CoA-carboxylase] ligase [Ferruginibacter yonginensis]|uniref:Biotin--[acetyl-CoA-carboxylase] ligase n=1 Tax=Ferruginibacter yonginensis TaxID=1310416 RepID=A0ABV8QV41_9BACT